MKQQASLGLKLSVGIMSLMIVLSTTTMGQTISDVSKTDAGYNAISNSVKNGYLSLNNKDTFLGQQPVTRREMALIIEKLLYDTDQQELNLTRNDIQEMKTLLKAFKSYMANYDSGLKTSALSLSKIEDEQKTLNLEMSRLNDNWRDKLNEMKIEQEKQTMYLWFGVAAAAFFGLVVK